MVLLILKWLSSILMFAGGALSLLWEPSVAKTAGGKKSLTHVGRLTILALLVGFLLFVATDIHERRENAQKLALQQTTIVDLKQVIQQLTRLSLDRELAELEISFEPSPEQSSRIAAAYRKIKSTSPPIPYSAATMRAERIGDHWKIDFDPVSRREGTIRFAPITPNEPKGKQFEDVIREALLPLWVKWGAGPETELEPKRNQFPSAIIVSENTVTFVLRPPVLALNLNYLNADPTFTVRGAGDIKRMRFRSKDPAVTFDDTFELNWQEDPGSDKDEDIYIKRTKPSRSGPHRLQIHFKTVS